MLFSHFHEFLQFSLVSFVQFFIENRSNLFYLTYNLILCLIEFFRPSDSHGFLLLYFFFILTFGKCLLYSSVSRLWNRSKACWVSVALLISSQLVVLIAWQNSSLFLREYNLLHIWVSTSDICIPLETWKIGKWSDTSVMNNPWMEWPISCR